MTAEFTNTALHWVIGILLVSAFLAFILQFMWPGFRVGRDFAQANERLKKLENAGLVLDLDHVATKVMGSDALRHAWKEYRDTLHGQKQTDNMGILNVSRWRATSMANAFFTDQALIEAPLRTEFYKHLPGILTGLGIIGTFSGLIIGLQDFKVTDDTQVVRRSLETLILSVGGAFSVSAFAIGFAILVTILEKFSINRLYSELEALCGLIDSLFEAGAGEEYLQRLVESSETSATQTMQMKESLVTDLKQVLTELTHQQITTMTATSANLGQVISTSLTEGLAEPLNRISNAVQAVGNTQGEAVNKLLTDVLGGFTAQMDNMFGSQMRGMNEMLVQTANTIQSASLKFEQLAGQMQQAGTGAADAMAQRIDQALQQMQMRQSEANDQMQLFIDQLRKNVANGQTESAELTMVMMKELSESTSVLVKSLQEQSHSVQQTQSAQQNERDEQMRVLMEQLKLSMAKGQSESADATTRLLGQLGDTTGNLIKGLQEQSHLAHQEHAQRQAELAAKTADLLNRQSEQVGRLSDTVEQASVAMYKTVDLLQTATHTNIERMGAGAEQLFGASAKLSDNLGMMKTASDGLNTMADKLSASATTLNSALTATQQTLGDQKAVRDALTAMVADLRSTVENAKREASMTAELVDSLQLASQRLTEVQHSADAYLAGVTNVMGEAHGAFAKQMEMTLRDGNRVFHQELAQATGLLKGAIQELGDVLENLPTSA